MRSRSAVLDGRLPLHPPPPATCRRGLHTIWDPSTLRLTKGDVTLFQSLGAPERRRACLILYNGDDQGKRLALDGELMVIGHAPECELHIDDPATSRRHAELQVIEQHVTLRDLGSVNGTFVNNERLLTPAKLKDGDLVRLGKELLKFYDRHSLDALLHDRIHRMATVDADTDLFSKKFLLDALEREIHLAGRSGRALSLLSLDLDHFKRVNDRHGNNAGNIVLREAALALKSAVRGGDMLGRTGGEEFSAVLPDTDLEAPAALTERL